MTSTPESSGRPLWRRSATALLLLIGLALAVFSFFSVQSGGDLRWHPAREMELQATYDAYRETGVLLIKETGSGSQGAQADSPGDFAAATWDDDPGSYIIASLMSHVTGSDSPYRGLTIVQGLLVALPLVWLPLAIARIFRSPRAGYALLALPFVMWVLNHGAGFVGTEYGLADFVSPTKVYAIYGIAASMAFLSLSLILLLSTYRLGLPVLILVTVLLGVLAGLGNLCRGLSGVGVALSIGVLWWLNMPKRWRLPAAAAAAAISVALSGAVQNGMMAVINVPRAEATEQPLESLPDAHALWHSMYMGLSFPEGIDETASRFEVLWSDEFGWNKAREVNPDVVISSQEYDDILRDVYMDAVLSDPLGAVILYVQKALYLAGYFSPLLAFGALGMVLVLRRRGPHRRLVAASFGIILPTLVIGLAPSVLVMPMIYYYSELSAALGILCTIALGGGIWALTTLGSVTRKQERERLANRAPVRDARHALSVVVLRTSSDADPLIAELAATASRDTELIFCGPSSDTEPLPVSGALIRRVAESSAGAALRAGVADSGGKRVVVVADPQSVNAQDVASLAEGEGSGLDYRSVPARGRPPAASLVLRAVRTFIVRTVPAGGVSAFATRGSWLRAFAAMSHESGACWGSEVLFAAAESGLVVRRVAAPGADASGEVCGLSTSVRLAWRRPEYVIGLTPGGEAGTPTRA